MVLMTTWYPRTTSTPRESHQAEAPRYPQSESERIFEEPLRPLHDPEPDADDYTYTRGPLSQSTDIREVQGVGPYRLPQDVQVSRLDDDYDPQDWKDTRPRTPISWVSLLLMLEIRLKCPRR